MHPEVKKFWANQGKSIVIDILENDLWTLYWVLIDDKGRQICFVGATRGQTPGTKDAPCAVYFINGREYSEREALKIVKMKAFL